METPKELLALRKKLFGNAAAPVFSNKGNILSNIPVIKNVISSTQAATIPWKTYAIGALVVIISILVLLLFIHILVTPVFPFTLFSNKLNGNIMGNDTEPQPVSKIYWEKDAETLLDSNTVLGTGARSTFNYSFTIDIAINPLSQTTFTGPPVLLYHGPAMDKDTAATNIAGALKHNYNIAIALDSSITNDLIISVLNVDNEVENILLQNVPVAKGFRLGVTITDKFMEVYLNGRLTKTRAFSASPKPISGAFFPVDERTASIVQVRNLRIFSDPITSRKMKEIAYSPPIFNFAISTDRYLSCPSSSLSMPTFSSSSISLPSFSMPKLS